VSEHTHPWTFIDPLCGQPAFHRTEIPLATTLIAPEPVEHLDGSRVLGSDPFICESCGRALWDEMRPDGPLIDSNHWQKRI
jgi:hypothetical protein